MEKIYLEEKTVPYIFASLAMLYGLLFILISPPFKVPDESSHTARAWQVGNGILFNGSIEGTIPKALQKIIDDYPALHKNYKFSKIKDEVLNGNSLDSNDLIAYKTNAFTYHPMPYLFSGLAMVTGEKLGFSALGTFYLGRIFNLIFWIFCLCTSIRIIPSYKKELAFIALIPMSLYQAASISADSVSNALSFLLFAGVTKILLSKDNSYKNYLTISFLTILTASFKLICAFPFILLFFNKSKFYNNKRFITYFILTLVLTLSTLAWPILNDIPQHHALKNVDLLGELFTNIFTPVVLLAKTISSNINFWLRGYIGYFGYFDCKIPKLLVYLYISGIICIFIFKCKISIDLPKPIRLASIILFLISVTAIIFTLYFTWPKNSLYVIGGVQGRYFIPIAPILFLTFAKTKDFTFIKGKSAFNFFSKHLWLLLLILTITGLSISSFRLWKTFFMN